MSHEHQYLEISSGKTKGNMKYKDVQCPECGRMKRMQEDGKMMVVKSGKKEKMMSEGDDMEAEE